MGASACISKSKTCPKCRINALFTSSVSAGTPIAAMEVTGFVKPHGTMYWKYSSPVETFKAQPCVETQRLRWTPMAPILPRSVQTPVKPAMRPAFNIEIRQCVDQHLLDRAQECAHIALPIAQVHNRIAHDLPRPVVRDVAAAIGFHQLDAGAPQRFFRGEQILFMPVAPDRDDMGMFDQQQSVHSQPLPALRRDPGLDRERLAPAHAPEVFYYALTH